MIGNFNEHGNEYHIKTYDLKRPLLNYFILIGLNNKGSGKGLSNRKGIKSHQGVRKNKGGVWSYNGYFN